MNRSSSSSRKDAAPRGIIHHPLYSHSSANARKSHLAYGHHCLSGLHPRLVGFQVSPQLAGGVPLESQWPADIKTTHAPLGSWARDSHQLSFPRNYHSSSINHCRQVRRGYEQSHTALRLSLGEQSLDERANQLHGALHHGEPRVPHHAIVGPCPNQAGQARYRDGAT